jgi:hypothetical protein
MIYRSTYYSYQNFIEKEIGYSTYSFKIRKERAFIYEDWQNTF